MKQAIVHIGFHKTASTSIQATLSQNRRLLRQAGWNYARFSRHGRDSSNHSAPLITLFEQNAGKYGINLSSGQNCDVEYQRYKKEFVENLRSDLPLIFSGEGASTLGEKGLERLRRTFEDNGRQLRVITFIRAPTQLLHSSAAEIVKGGSSEVLHKAPLRHRLSKRVEAVRAVFPDAEFYSFEETRRHERGPVGFFLDLIDPNLASYVQIIQKNDRISENSVALLRHLNTVIPFYIRTPELKVNPLRLHGDSRPLLKLSGKRFYLGSAEIEKMRDDIAEQNAWLAENLGPEFCDTEQVAAECSVLWTDEHAGELRAILRWMPKHLRVAVASYFDNIPDLPRALEGFAERYRAGQNPLLRYSRGGLGIGVLESAYRKLRGQW